MNLIVGLGNHGKKYSHNRHNFGFMLADQIIQDYNFKFAGVKFNSEFFYGEIKHHKFTILKPQTYMNNSGIAVRECLNFYKIALENLLVLHDELDIELGKIKFKKGGGNAGHNGLKSITENVGNDYFRLRLGISRPQNSEFEIADYVLSNFNEDQQKIVEIVNKKISQDILLYNNLV